MNREIRFRGKKVIGGNWVDGHNIMLFGDGAYGIQRDNWGGTDIVVTETVGQFSGLSDKNKIPIYSGDIVAVFNFENLEFQHEVVFQKGAFGYKTEHYFVSFVENNSFDWVNGKSDRILVIGNVFDNPELIENEVAT